MADFPNIAVRSPAAPVPRAILGPTNTGKTHLAVERLCGHSSGMIGFPLRLLAREIYDRVVAIKGAAQTALVTGEERIIPPHARYWLSTIEAMPVDRDVAFVGVDEVQLGADPERGHMFTDRILRARGREETLLLGSAIAAPVVRALVPGVDTVTRPRFSTLSFAGSSKLSRLPKRSAIVAFSAEDVYVIAETLRRFSGGAAVVMGALSPRTRNAQVAMFESGEVDYLVATDAIGMGLNLNVDHVAFAGLGKFDGRRHRRLTLPEMGQIAGRAGRHQRDGTFGTIGAPMGGFTPEEVEAIEAHAFPPLTHMFWRNPHPDMTDLASLIASLDQPPATPELRPAPQAIDIAVLKHLGGDPAVMARADDPGAVRALWDCCGLPDFEKLGAEHHSRTVMKLWGWRTTGSGQVDGDWFAARLARHGATDGDIGALAGRLAAVRTLCFIAQRDDWIGDAAGWAAQAAVVEEKLSDALHQALTQRFVDRRLGLLLTGAGRRAGDLPVQVAADGRVGVDGETIGTLDGFQFRVDPAARAGDHRLLLAAAGRHLRGELAARAQALIAADDGELALADTPGAPPMLVWRGTPVARLVRGGHIAAPALVLEAVLRQFDAAITGAIAARLAAYIAGRVARHAAPLAAMAAAASDLFTPPEMRAILARLCDGTGHAARAALAEPLAALTPELRRRLRPFGLTIGSLDIFNPALLKPGAVRWRAALAAAWQGGVLPQLPPVGAVHLTTGDPAGLAMAGFRQIGTVWLRIDMAERIARGAHAVRLAAASDENAVRLAAASTESAVRLAAAGNEAAAPAIAATPPPARRLGFPLDPALATSLGLDAAGWAALLRELGFRPIPPPAAASADTVAAPRWLWAGMKARAKPHPAAVRPARAPATAARAAPGPASPRPAKTTTKAPTKPPPAHSPFAGLAQLLAAGKARD